MPLHPFGTLMEAAWSEDAEHVRAILRQGVDDLEAVQNEGHLTAFLLACYKGSAECICALAEAGCDKAAVTDKGVTALMQAVASGEAAAVRAVFGLGVKDKEARDINGGDTAFLWACYCGSPECIGLLAEAGCDKNAVSDAGETALMRAVFSNEVAAVRAVLDLGVDDKEARNENGRTAFLHACREGSPECIGLLAGASCDKDTMAYDGATALMHAAASGEAAAVRAVLDLGVADCERRDNAGSTAFLYACCKGSAECIGLLAEAGCDKDAVCNIGGTALMQAAFSGEAAAVRVVLDLGVKNKEARNESSDTAFLIACYCGSPECIGLLAGAECDKDTMSDEGATALMHAVFSNEVAAVRVVLYLGVKDKEARGENDDTAFLIACNKGSAECIGLLAEAGCDKDAVSDNGATALMHAVASREAAAVQAVLDLGVANREMRSRDGRTAFLLACHKGSAACIAVLAEAGCDTAATMSAPEERGSRRWGARDVAKHGKDCPPEAFELLDKLEHERMGQTMKLEVERLLAAAQFAEAKSVLQKALSVDPGSATLLALQRQAAERLEHAEQISRQKEAELLAEIEVENGVRVENTGVKSKAQMKRERQRQKQKEQAARDEVSALLDQLGLAEHLRLCLDNEMDIGATANWFRAPHDNRLAADDAI